jgi:hypothetical protein
MVGASAVGTPHLKPSSLSSPSLWAIDRRMLDAVTIPADHLGLLLTTALRRRTLNSLEDVFSDAAVHLAIGRRRGLEA